MPMCESSSRPTEERTRQDARLAVHRWDRSSGSCVCAQVQRLSHRRPRIRRVPSRASLRSRSKSTQVDTDAADHSKRQRRHRQQRTGRYHFATPDAARPSRRDAVLICTRALETHPHRRLSGWSLSPVGPQSASADSRTLERGSRFRSPGGLLPASALSRPVSASTHPWTTPSRPCDSRFNNEPHTVLMVCLRTRCYSLIQLIHVCRVPQAACRHS